MDWRRLLVAASVLAAGCVPAGGEREGSQTVGVSGAEVAFSQPGVGRYPDVDQYDEQFWAGLDNAIDSWIREKGSLPLEREILFGCLIEDIRAVATIESHGDAGAYNQASGARGLMQLIPQVNLSINEGEDPNILFDPHYNIFRGTWYYTVIWLEIYEGLGQPADLAQVSRIAAAQYYGSGKMNLDRSNWSEDVWVYVERFEGVKLAAQK